MYARKGKVILYTGQIRGFLYFHQRRIEYNLFSILYSAKPAIPEGMGLRCAL